jgi:hypothetical protein
MRCASVLALLSVLAACSPGERDGAGDTAAALARDPLVARALYDPLMSDPDLAARNEANALLGFAGDSALPVLPATSAAAQKAREAARLELIEGGAVAALPGPASGAGPVPGRGASAAELVAALGAPEDCVTVLEQGFGWAAAMPEPAAIMPHGMVVRAGGSETSACRLRIIRYHTPAAVEDVLEYHFTRAERAGLRPVRYAEDEAGIAALAPGGEALAMAVRILPSGMTEVDLLYRTP